MDSFDFGRKRSEGYRVEVAFTVQIRYFDPGCFGRHVDYAAAFAYMYVSVCEIIA